MIGSNARMHPVQLVVNYWEIPTSRLQIEVDSWLKKGINEVHSFVPWQVFESDISHSLTKFLQCVTERKIRVKLTVTPEVGTHAHFCGYPKDIANNQAALAKDVNGKMFHQFIPPRAFALPSLTSELFTKRYQGYLNRLQSYFSDLEQYHPRACSFIQITIGGSTWKYQRPAEQMGDNAFGASSGDYSNSANLTYRKAVEEFVSQTEFQVSSPQGISAQTWKNRSMDSVNRKWFNQHSEELFRNRTTFALKRKLKTIPISQLELYCPEADPALFFDQVLQSFSGAATDFSKLNKLLDSYSCRLTESSGQICHPFIYWSGYSGFQELSESEKQFLFIKSIIQFGPAGGGVFINLHDWLKMSEAFRNKIELLAEKTAQGEFTKETEILYYTASTWATPTALGQVLEKHFPNITQITASQQCFENLEEARLLVVDQEVIITQKTLVSLLGWLREGRVLVIPKNPLMTTAAKRELEAVMNSRHKMLLNIGHPYEVSPFSGGKIVLVSAQDKETWTQNLQFIQSMVGLSDIQTLCGLSDGRIQGISVQHRIPSQGRFKKALFILNPTFRTVNTDIMFENPVSVSDLGSAFSQANSDQSVDKKNALPERRFTLEVPPFGVLPLEIESLDNTHEERRLAASLSKQTLQGANEAAGDQLQGLNTFDGSIEDSGDMWS